MKPASPGIRSQLNRIRSGKHPHYRATTKSLELGPPGELSLQERVEIERMVTPCEADSAVLQQAEGGSLPGLPTQASVLAAFGILESELPRVKSLGQRVAAEASDNESEASDGELF